MKPSRTGAKDRIEGTDGKKGREATASSVHSGGGMGVGGDNRETRRVGAAPWKLRELTKSLKTQNRGGWEDSVMGIICRNGSVRAGQA